MTNEVTTVTLPRELFDKVAILAKREHRSTRGQIMHILAAATINIGFGITGDQSQAHTQRKLTAKERAAEERDAEQLAEHNGRKAAEAQAVRVRELKAIFAKIDAETDDQ
jgi:hypothetical protein